MTVSPMARVAREPDVVAAEQLLPLCECAGRRRCLPLQLRRLAGRHPTQPARERQQRCRPV